MGGKNVRPAPSCDKIDGYAERDPRQEGGAAQFEADRREPAPEPADRRHRAERLGQVARSPSIRSSPRASAATSSACRPTPASIIEQMEKPEVESDRGHLAVHLHRPEDDLDQSPLDRRHRHRDLRPLPAALRAGRRRPTARAAAGPSAPRPPSEILRSRSLEPFRAKRSASWRPSSRAARANTRGSSSACERRAFSGPGSTAQLRDLEDEIRPRKDQEAHDRGPGRHDPDRATTRSGGSARPSTRPSRSSEGEVLASTTPAGRRSSPSACSALTARSACPSSSPGISPSTAPTAPARAATAWATRRRLDEWGEVELTDEVCPACRRRRASRRRASRSRSAAGISTSWASSRSDLLSRGRRRSSFPAAAEARRLQDPEGDRRPPGHHGASWGCPTSS